MNSVELIGVVRRIEEDDSNNQYLVLEVSRPYLDNEQSFIYDYLTVCLIILCMILKMMMC